ncbi:helicase-related protein [Pseudomonas aeruginosa]|uniref:helicase-related protein n=1 Tax=Pseudomonadota TaxID=1224 RepID=UPI00053EF6A9|nr:MULTISPECIES: helicase-related protein [Pseudomonadota]ELI8871547.1 helicase [Pseudomonas aeruginosa]MCU9261022.1 helicase-related protein [Pseudomonas aeruginosa]HBP5594194.1 helicase [Pseudomonas aeruginosa]HBP5597028.1 helicase [Pseudomonas aeruginosa]HBP5632033.1 helicase [Pseudomonas aeruginosa]
MKLIQNTGTQRVIDLMQPHLKHGNRLDCVTPSFSLYAFAEIREALSALDRVQLIVPPDNEALELLGTESDRAARNRLQARWLANQCAKWITEKVALRRASKGVPQGAAVMRGPDGAPAQVVLGSLAFSTSGLGLTPGNPLNLIQTSETADEAAQLAQWFDQQWSGLQGAAATDSKDYSNESESVLEALQALGEHRDPFTIYTLMLHRLFQDSGDEMDEERIVKSATGIRNTVVWKKLFKFQRDGVVGAIDKLNRFGGCIIADSVGLGKTFEALAIIKYHELRNDRVLVLAPKRLRDNWTLYKANDKRNILAADRFNYDVLNHTDLSRDGGVSGDIDLSHVNWGNYDLVVIDESHNFRNKATHKGKESRYDRLMRRIIREGVKTRVLMLSATPVNNRLADLRNQIAFATEGDDAALMEHGIASIEATTRKAQAQFNRWLALDEAEKTPTRLVEMLGFDYFTLLDHLTIARSRRHVEKYYGTSETGRFPDRLPPINIKADVDLAGEFRSIRDINQEIRRLTLASYAPLRYVLPHKQAAYDAKYSTQVRGGEGFFRQADREESLIHLLRVNVLKRMESCVSAFTLTVQRQLKDVENTLARIESHAEALEEIDIADVDIDDPAFETLLVGRKVKVLLGDVDLIRWKQDLLEDRNRLATLLAAARQVDAARDAKLAALQGMIARKCAQPINTHDGKANRKIIVFTAFSDTAHYLYAQLAPWARDTLGVHSAVVTGSAGIQTTMPGLSKRMGDVLSAFAPRAKERPQDLADEGEIDLLIATDCISEGQNLQDCDWLINYDIHWNPVRIIQRFGRIDRIGSPNQRIQLVNFWPNMELEEYINLEQRVSGRMVLLDVSATGEENLIEQQSGNAMNDLEYRRKQLLKLQDTVIDMEDLSTGVAITDLTLTDFRIDLAQYLKSHPGKLDTQPLGAYAVTTTLDADIPPGVIFCLQAYGPTVKAAASSDYPLAPHYLVHVGDDGTVLLPYPQAKRILDRLKRLALGRERPDDSACARFDKASKGGEDMRHAQKLLAAAVASVTGKHEERAVASLFTPGGTHAMKGEFAGSGDFEVVAFLVVLPDEQSI